MVHEFLRCKLCPLPMFTYLAALLLTLLLWTKAVIPAIITLRKIPAFRSSFCIYIGSAPEHGKIPVCQFPRDKLVLNTPSLIRIVFLGVFYFSRKHIFRFIGNIGFIQLLFQSFIFILKTPY